MGGQSALILTSVDLNIFTEVNINVLCPPIIQYHRNTSPQPLYSVSLPTCPLSTHKENESINVLSIQNRIDFSVAPYSLQNFQPGAKQLKMFLFNIGLN